MRRLLAFVKGIREHNQTYTAHIEHPDIKRAYDKGRAFAHFFTRGFK